MKVLRPLILPFFFNHFIADAQSINWFPKADSSLDNNLYFYWGYNRAGFSSSNLHFSAPDYVFSLKNVTASDRPTPFSFKTYFNPNTLSIPQYNYRLGFMLNPRWGISLGIDHMKYVLDYGQETSLSGIIDKTISEKYAGSYLHESITLEEAFLHFEHTDGLNFVSIDVERHFPIAQIEQWRQHLDSYIGAGGIWMVTRTDVGLFGQSNFNNDFHVAGFSGAAKIGLRWRFFRKLFFQVEWKGGFTYLPSVLIHNDSPEIAEHSFWYLQRMGALGGYFKF